MKNQTQWCSNIFYIYIQTPLYLAKMRQAKMSPRLVSKEHVTDIICDLFYMELFHLFKHIR